MKAASTRWTRMVASAIVTALAVSLAVIGPSARSAEAMVQPFVGVSPQRVLETRSGPNDTTVDGQQQGVGVLAADQTRDVPVLGRGTIPATGVAAVALNVTAISPSATSFLTLFPTGSTRPNASNLNLAAGRTLPNMVIVPVGTNGSISVYNSAGTTHLAVDVLGWFPTGSAYQGLSPERLLDTRPSGVTVDGLQQATTAFNPGETRVLSIGGRGSVPAAGVGAVVLNVTAVGPSADAFITAFPTGASRPNASNLNTAAGRTLPNMAIVPVGDGGSISLFNSAGTTHLIVDVLGWFPVGTAFAGLTPARLLDTRPSGLTIDGLQQNTGVFTAETRTLVIAGRGGLPATDMGAVALNITAISPTTNAFITVFPAGSQRPTASNLNLAAGRTVPNMVIVPVGAGGAISIFNSAGTTHLAVDVLGWFPSPSAAGTSLVSELLDNAPRGGSTAESIISRDGGFVAFASLAANHVYGDTNGRVDVFVANTETGAVELASLSNTDQPLNGTSDEPAISDDGRFVVFTTDAAAVSSDTNGIDDVYVRDRQAGTTTLVSLRADGSQFVSASGGQVSGNGNVVAFVAVQIGAFDALVESIFVRDVAAGTTVLASPSAANFNIGSAGSTSISQDGDKVAVVKRRSSGSASHIFRFDRSSGTFTQFTPSASNVSDPQGGTRPVLADDGAAVVYERAGDLFQFVANGTEQRVDVSTANVAANGASANARFAGSSHDVIFDSQGSNLVTGDANGVGDVFLRTTGTTKTTTLLSVRVKAGITTFANNASLTPSMSADRSKLVFRSLASNLAPQATAGRVNLLLNQGRGVTYQQVDLGNGTTVAHGASERPALTPDGRYVVFASTAADLVIGDGNNATDVFRLDRVTHQVVKASVSNSAGELPAGGSVPDVDDAGTRVAFLSNGTVTLQTNGTLQLYVRDIAAGTTVLASPGTAANTLSSSAVFEPSISGNGRFVVFASGAANLVADDTNGRMDVFIRDLQTNTTERVNLSSTDEQAVGADTTHLTLAPTVSADGRFVAFTSTATNMVPGATTAVRRVYVRDRHLGTTTLIALGDDGTISDDGTVVAFRSGAALVGSDTNAVNDVYLASSAGGNITRVSESTAGAQGNGQSSAAALGADGRFVTFTSDANNLVPGDTNGASDVFLHDTLTGATTRVSVGPGGQQGDATSQDGSPSADGRFIVFSSFASNLVPDDINAATDVFVRDTGVLAP